MEEYQVMKKLILVLVAFGLALGFTTQAPATPMPGDKLEELIGIEITVDKVKRSIPFGLLKNDRKGFSLENPLILHFGKDTVNVTQLLGKFDPVLNLGIAVQDIGAPSTFGFSIISPLNPALTGKLDYEIDLVGGFTDGGSDGGSISGTALNGVMDVSLNNIIIDGLGPNANFPNPPNAYAYGPFNKTGSIVGGPYNTFNIAFGFTGSGNDDVVTLNGRFEINPVPEPATMLLIGTGLLGLAGFTRRFRKN
jgi:hypothetical protein